MKNVLAWLITGIVSIAIFLTAVGYQQDATARRFYAQAAIVREQSQARQDLLAAMLPYVALAVVVIVLITVTGLVIYGLSRNSDRPQAVTRIIETRTIILLQPGQTRRDVFKQLTGPKKGESNYEIL